MVRWLFSEIDDVIVGFIPSSIIPTLPAPVMMQYCQPAEPRLVNEYRDFLEYNYPGVLKPFITDGFKMAMKLKHSAEFGYKIANYKMHEFNKLISMEEKLEFIKTHATLYDLLSFVVIVHDFHEQPDVIFVPNCTLETTYSTTPIRAVAFTSTNKGKHNTLVYEEKEDCYELVLAMRFHPSKYNDLVNNHYIYLGGTSPSQIRLPKLLFPMVDVSRFSELLEKANSGNLNQFQTDELAAFQSFLKDAIIGERQDAYLSLLREYSTGYIKDAEFTDTFFSLYLEDAATYEKILKSPLLLTDVPFIPESSGLYNLIDDVIGTYEVKDLMAAMPESIQKIDQVFRSSLEAI